MPQRKKGMLALAGGGDDGTTSLLGGGRATKDDLRIEAYGTVDEASSALGLARSLSRSQRVKEICQELQRGLYKLGAELATSPEQAGNFAHMTQADVAREDELIAQLEAEVSMPTGFVLPGATAGSGALDLARAVVRRAERRVVQLRREDGFNQEALRYLNRLSLLLFVLARVDEHESGVKAEPARGALERKN